MFHFQLNKLRSLLDGHQHSLVDNYRPVQAINNRQVMRSFQQPSYIVDNENDENDDLYGSAPNVHYNFYTVTAIALVNLVALKVFT